MSVGFDFLHTHPELERMYGIDKDHCIVDRADLSKVQKLFLKHAKLIEILERDHDETPKTTITYYSKRNIL